jgi:bidirectional [NiFe] hydrogenase diaphorase subunit
MVQHSDDRYKMVEKTMKKLGYDRSGLIETLHMAQETFGYLENDTLKFIARRLRLPLSKVYGVATFYHFFRLKPKGKHTAVVCMGTACYIKGADKILASLEKRFGIKAGETTKDALISVLTARCVGSCSLAPIAIYDNKPVGKLSLEQSLQEVEELIS